ncbi:MAG: DUF3575 domain-containing protein [Muribaculaceae bacterium]|nr:DUF3575 domain-containing protein [Muribaculaceae bacterium]
MKKISLILFSALTFMTLSAKTAQSAGTLADSVILHFPVSQTVVRMDYMGNAARLEEFVDRLDSIRSLIPAPRLESVDIFGEASPEGNLEFNKYLAEHRATATLRVLRNYISVPDSLLTIGSAPARWEEANKLAAGRGADYMRRDVLPYLRNAELVLVFRRPMPINMSDSMRVATPTVAVLPPEMAIGQLMPAEWPDVSERRKIYWALRTNLLYDAAAIPTLGAEIYLGRQWSVQGEWMYAWWSHRVSNFFWRTYGGDIGVRRWLGERSRRNPLTGHHLGVYFQALIWDVELGGTGYMGGVPGKMLWDKANLGGGIEYGYTLPVGRHWCFDFTLGVGYLGGSYRVYEPQCGYYVWQSTHSLRYFGPTKLEVSLVYRFP